MSTPLDLLRAYAARMDRTISDNDGMVLRGADRERSLASGLDWERQYFFVAEEGLRAVVKAMIAAERTSFRRILDLPCGHGRVLRALRAAFPEAEITACDLDRDGVDFCARTFGARPVYSAPEPDDIPLAETFDLVFCNSLLTHVDARRFAAFLAAFARRLEPDGLLVFTTHGRWGVPFHHTVQPLIDPALFASVEAEFHATGFGYADYPDSPGYGISLSSMDWVLRTALAHPDLVLVYAQERGLGNFQDVFAFTRRRFDDPKAPIRLRDRAIPYRGAIDDPAPPAPAPTPGRRRWFRRG